MNFDFRVRDRDGKVIPSQLQVEMSRRLSHGTSSLPNHNEASPQLHLKAAIGDVLAAYGVKGEVITEASLFSVRPDLVVVTYKGRIIFMVEVKNPSSSHLQVFLSEVAAGQCHEYNLVQKQAGTDQPFVLLSTFIHPNKIRRRE